MNIFDIVEGTRCWKGYTKKGMKTMFGKRVPNCVKNEDLDPEGPEVTIGDYTTTHFFMCGSAIKTAEKHADKPGMEGLIRLQDIFYKLEKAVMDTGESTDEAKEFAHTLHDEIMSQAREIGIEEEVADYQQSHLNSVVKGDPEPGFGRVDLNENLRDWFGKGKEGGAGGGGWDAYDSSGNRIGKCGDTKGKSKPKCLSKSAAAKLRNADKDGDGKKDGKAGIARAVKRKRRKDPNRNRRGKAKNVKK